MKQTVKERRTLVRFAVQKTDYQPGKGTVTRWDLVTVPCGTGEDGEPILTDCFYAEWLNSYGMNAIRQQSEGVMQAARVRLPYVKEVYEALLQKDVRIYLGGVMDGEHTFILASSPNNYLEQRKMIEIQVK